MASAARKKPNRARHRVTLMPGDGIGPEVIRAAVKVVDAAGAKILWDEVEVGALAVKRQGTPLPANVFTSLARTKVGLKGPIETPIAKGFPSANVALRKELNLYANLRPIKTLPGVKSRYDNVDLVVVRENTESLYAGVEHTVAPGVVESVKIITWEACTRIAKFAFDYAERMGRKRITAVHKANIMKLSDGLFLEASRKIALRHPKIHYDEVIVDALCMKLVVNPNQFDILLCENLYGDIVSDLCSGFVGGLGMAPGANIGSRGAVFEPVHGSAPDIAGKGIANPAAMLMAAELMLYHLGEKNPAEKIHHALLRALRNRKVLTPDLGGKGNTETFTNAVLKAL
jgi:isocitrate dehydrogenase (NAD+)